MTVAASTAIRNAWGDAIISAIGSAGLLRVYDGTRPASGGTATTLLAELTLGSPFAPAASSGVVTANAITSDTNANASGTATWARIVTSGGTFCLDIDVGLSGSGAEAIINNTTIASGDTVGCSSLTLTAPAA